MSEGIEPQLARYLHASPDQRRLLDAMTTGHARGKHGHEIGDPSPDGRRLRPELTSPRRRRRGAGHST